MSVFAAPPPNIHINNEDSEPPDGNSLFLRQEVWGPTEELESGTRYVFPMPKTTAWDEVIFDSAVTGTVILTVQIKIAGANLFPYERTMNTNVLHVPKALWSTAFQSGILNQDARVELEVTIQSYGPYTAPWNGLGVTFVKA